MTRLTKSMLQEMHEAASPVSYYDLHEDLQQAADNYREDARRWDYSRVGEIPIKWIWSPLPFESSLDVFWDEDDENIRTALKYPGVRVEAMARATKRGVHIRDLTFKDIKSALLYGLPDDICTDSYGLPEDFDAPTEFGRVLGIMRWLDGLPSVGEMTPVLVTPQIVEGTPRLMLVDGWHRCTAATIRRWSSISAILMEPATR